jgi:hypothetical protein
MRAGLSQSHTSRSPPARSHYQEPQRATEAAPQKHVWRARIILAAADSCRTTEIMRRSGKSKPIMWAWQPHFMGAGTAGLLRDKTRKPGKTPLPSGAVKRVIETALASPPGA